MGISFPLRGSIREILQEMETACEELGVPELVDRMNDPPLSSIHRLLERLENGRWVQSRVEKVPGERTCPRRFYRITKLGKQALMLQRAYEEVSGPSGESIETHQKGRPS